MTQAELARQSGGLRHGCRNVSSANAASISWNWRTWPRLSENHWSGSDAAPGGKSETQPDHITLRNNLPNIKKMLLELILRPRRDLAKWAEITKADTQHKDWISRASTLLLLVTGVEGSRSGARGHDLCDESEVKSCSSGRSTDKCKDCMAAVARIENECPGCRSTNIKRNNDSKWLLTVKSDGDLRIPPGSCPAYCFHHKRLSELRRRRMDDVAVSSV